MDNTNKVCVDLIVPGIEEKYNVFRITTLHLYHRFILMNIQKIFKVKKYIIKNIVMIKLKS